MAAAKLDAACEEGRAAVVSRRCVALSRICVLQAGCHCSHHCSYLQCHTRGTLDVWQAPFGLQHSLCMMQALQASEDRLAGAGSCQVLLTVRLLQAGSSCAPELQDRGPLVVHEGKA